jgi:hypothetical protein
MAAGEPEVTTGVAAAQADVDVGAGMEGGASEAASDDAVACCCCCCCCCAAAAAAASGVAALTLQMATVIAARTRARARWSSACTSIGAGGAATTGAVTEADTGDSTSVSVLSPSSEVKPPPRVSRRGRADWWWVWPESSISTCDWECVGGCRNRAKESGWLHPSSSSSLL